MIIEEDRLNQLSSQIIGSSISVHKSLGPGLLESLYLDCLCHELSIRSLSYKREAPLSIIYKGATFESKLRADIIVEDSIIVELKAVDGILPIHFAQLMTYLKIANIELGLLINFNVQVLKQGLHRVRLNHGNKIR